ncbi:MAG: hypothetical protein K0Q65_1058 [Clostridia bacterium]|nr:hypothetical protein [Clostridia bacterium]
MKKWFRVYNLLLPCAFIVAIYFRVKANYALTLSYVNIISCGLAVATLIASIQDYYKDCKSVLRHWLWLLHFINGGCFAYQLFLEISANIKGLTYTIVMTNDIYTIVALGICLSNDILVGLFVGVIKFIEATIEWFMVIKESFSKNNEIAK